MNDELWLPALFGISIISSVLKVSNPIRAIRGVLLPLINTHRPSNTPVVCEISGWWASSQGTKPKDVSNMGFVSSVYPHPFVGNCENTGISFSIRPDGSPYTVKFPVNPPEKKP